MNDDIFRQGKSVAELKEILKKESDDFIRTNYTNIYFRNKKLEEIGAAIDPVLTLALSVLRHELLERQTAEVLYIGSPDTPTEENPFKSWKGMDQTSMYPSLKLVLPKRRVIYIEDGYEFYRDYKSNLWRREIKDTPGEFGSWEHVEEETMEGDEL